MLRNAEFKQPDWRLCQEGQEASFPIDHMAPSARANATEPGFAENIKPEDYSRIVESLRTLADDIEEEHTTVRCD